MEAFFKRCIIQILQNTLTWTDPVFFLCPWLYKQQHSQGIIFLPDTQSSYFHAGITTKAKLQQNVCLPLCATHTSASQSQPMGRSPRSASLQAFWYFKGLHKKDRDKLLHGLLWRADGNSFKPKEGQFRFDSRKKLFTMRGGSTSTGCPEMVDAPSLGNIQGQVGWTLSNLI